MPGIDQYSIATVPLEMRFGATHLAIGTGFVWERHEKFYLITNWHNVSGKDPFTQKHISTTCGEPDRLVVWWNGKNALPRKFSAELPIRDSETRPLWLIHPNIDNHVDVVALQHGYRSNSQ